MNNITSTGQHKYKWGGRQNETQQKSRTKQNKTKKQIELGEKNKNEIDHTHQPKKAGKTKKEERRTNVWKMRGFVGERAQKRRERKRILEWWW